MQFARRRSSSTADERTFGLAPFVAVWLGIVSLVIGCGSTRQADYRELREYALDESVPLETRSDTLLAMARSEEESTHLRAVAVQMLGVLQIEEAKPVLMRILGEPDEPRAERRARPVEAAEEEVPAEEATELPWVVPDGETRPSRSELLRMEAVIGLGRFGQPQTYDAVLRLIYEERRESSPMVLRQYVQSFAHAMATPDSDASATAEVLLRWLRLALDRNEDESLVRTALHELRRLTNRPDLNAGEITEWQDHIARMRLGVRPPVGSE